MPYAACDKGSNQITFPQIHHPLIYTVKWRLRFIVKLAQHHSISTGVGIKPSIRALSGKSPAWPECYSRGDMGWERKRGVCREAPVGRNGMSTDDKSFVQMRGCQIEGWQERDTEIMERWINREERMGGAGKHRKEPTAMFVAFKTPGNWDVSVSKPEKSTKTEQHHHSLSLKVKVWNMKQYTNSSCYS